jgi:hypothetical protein
LLGRKEPRPKASCGRPDAAAEGDPDPTSAGTVGEAARWGGSSAVVGMAANPFGAHRVGPDRADYMACRYASGHNVVGRVGRSASVTGPTRPCKRFTSYLDMSSCYESVLAGGAAARLSRRGVAPAATFTSDSRRWTGALSCVDGGAGGRTRTDTPFGEQVFETCASTNSATPACQRTHPWSE